MAQNSKEFQRLPHSVKAVNYKLDFVPNFADFTFSAEASIKMKVVEPTNRIIMNSMGLEISNARYMDSEATINFEESKDLVIFTFPSTLQAGEGKLSMCFKGKFSDDMQGFYRSKYELPDGKMSDILCTQFESVYARRAFPCMDEPDRKATYDISLTVLDNKVALSNMPEVSREVLAPPAGLPAPPDGHNYVKVQFDTSPIMSTYLVAMVVGDFEYISEKDSNGVEVRVFTPMGKRETGRYALEVSLKTLPFYATLFGHKFPLPKCDLIAIPDFGCGAMENWGLITYRETALLIDQQNSSLLSKGAVALTVAHELAHMWFGNLVTMEWWTHLWLNEGFATWIEYLAVDYCFPDYDIWDMFVSREYTRALKLDELKNSHPIEVEVKGPHEVEEIFDAVSYQKGASVIRMLSDYLGAETFRAGLQAYIDRHKYSNTVTEHLWTALSEVSGENVEEIMSTWTKQMGFPVLSVRLIPAAADGSSGYSLGVKQQRFLAEGGSEDTTSKWHIPVTICRADDSSTVLTRTLIPAQPKDSGKSETIVPLPADAFAAEGGIRLNPGAIGFYRVQYDEAMLPPILRALAEGKMSARERLSLIDDYFAMARSGQCKLTTVLDLCRAFTGESQFNVWSVLSAGLGGVQSLLLETSYPPGDASNDVVFPAEPSKEIAGLHALYTQMALPVYKKIGFDARPDADTNNDRLLRPIIVSLLGRAGHAEVLEKARSAFARHYEAVTATAANNKSNSVDEEAEGLISPDLRTSVYAMCVRNGGEEEFQRLLTLHDKAKMQDERVRLLSCLGTTRVPALLERLIALTFSDYVRKQDRFHVLLGMTGSPAGRRALWHSVVGKRLAEGSLVEDLATTAMLSYVLKGSCSEFCSQSRYDEVDAFFKKHHVPCQRAIQQALESIKINIGRVARDKESASEFLRGLTNKS